MCRECDGCPLEVGFSRAQELKCKEYVEIIVIYEKLLSKQPARSLSLSLSQLLVFTTCKRDIRWKGFWFLAHLVYVYRIVNSVVNNTWLRFRKMSFFIFCIPKKKKKVRVKCGTRHRWIRSHQERRFEKKSKKISLWHVLGIFFCSTP